MISKINVVTLKELPTDTFPLVTILLWTNLSFKYIFQTWKSLKIVGKSKLILKFILYGLKINVIQAITDELPYSELDKK